MKIFRFTYFLLLLFVFLRALPLKSQELPLSDSSQISLLTVTPGDEVYAQYGHTAIRIVDFRREFDLVFNYGLFDFNTPNFLYKFIKGETDYICGVGGFSDFIIEYQLSERGVVEQILNLSATEKERIWQALVQNIQIENRTYRYNYLYNNCATKPRDLILSNLDGKTEYAYKEPFKSLRDEIHYFTKKYPWTQFGIDLLLGAPIDNAASLSDQQFAPEILKQSFDKANIVDSNKNIKPLVTKTNVLIALEYDEAEKKPSVFGPNLVIWILFFIIAFISVYESRKEKRGMTLTAIIFGIYGLIGSLIAFLWLFSEHPGTEVNFLLLWLNPLHLFFAIGIFFQKFRKYIATKYLIFSLTLQVIALFGIFFIPQQLNPATVPMLLIIAFRSIVSMLQPQSKASHE